MRARRQRAHEAPVELRIGKLDERGRGVAVIEDRSMVVEHALPGERILARRVRRRAGHDEGELVEVLEAADDRVEPRCRFFGICGACALQHMSTAAQLSFKEKRLFAQLEAAGGVLPERRLEPLHATAWGYRRRARLGVKDVPKKGRVLVGFRERGAPYLADMTSCEVLVPEAAVLIRPLSDLIGTLSLRARIPQVEVSAGDAGLALVFRVLDPPTPEDLEALTAFEARHGAVVYLQSGGPDSVRPLGEAPDRLRYSVPGHDVEIHFEPLDFVQVNGALNTRMVEQALGLLQVEPGIRVLELFSGLGNFSLPLARKGARVTAVEGDAGLVARARDNAIRHGLEERVEAHVADLFADCSQAAWAVAPYDAVLLDPPRAGAGPVLEIIASRGAGRIVYVSCNPETLAADTRRLVGQYGYRLASAGVMDMFPHTQHVESIALFEAGRDGH